MIAQPNTKKTNPLIYIGAFLNLLCYIGEMILFGLFLIARSPIVAIRRYKAKKIEAAQDSSYIETDLAKINLGVFNEYLETGDYTKLIVSGEPTPKQINAALADIMDRYYKVSGNQQALQAIREQELIKQYEVRERGINIVLDALEMKYDARLCELLKTHYGYDTKEFSEDTYLKDIEWVKTAEIGKQIDYERRVRNREKQPDAGGWKGVILSNLYEIRKYEKLPQAPAQLMRELTVLDYCGYMERLRGYIQAVEMQETARRFSKGK